MKANSHFLNKIRMRPLRTLGIIIACFCFNVSVLTLMYIAFILRTGPTAFNEFLEILHYCLLIGVFLSGPAVLTLYNILYLILPHSCETMRKRSQYLEPVTIIFGGICFYLAALLSEIHWDMNWWEQLYNNELHAPIATWTYPTLITMGSIGLVGYLILYVARLRQIPPLLTVLGLSGMYIGMGLCMVMLIQFCSNNWILCIYLGNLLLIFLKVLKELVIQFKSHSQPEGSKLQSIRQLLQNGQSLPLVGFLLVLPLLGIALAVLTLFGQEPDSIIQAWTQTSDWTFSQQIAPPNLPMDMHYLCTVAARGHQSLVKPLRMGMRHGHRVLVNRQLEVANAFEELLQERSPGFHRLLRAAYDRFGYPIANHIRSPWVSDAVWLLMKPAEWFFLGVLYLFDCNPENRIAVQYPHAPLPQGDHHKH